MELKIGVHTHRHHGHNYLRSSSLNMPHNYSETMVATPTSHYHYHHPHLNQSLRSTNNSMNNSGTSKKRDFHFQVIQVNQGPKWFFFPNQSDNEKNDSKSSDAQNCQSENSTSVNTPKRSSVTRRKEQFQKMHQVNAVDGELTKVSSTNTSSNEPSSEPSTRRLNCKPIIKVTQSPSIPIRANNDDSNCSNSVPSSTFKILSVAKKDWESDDEDLIECSCRKLSLSLDDDCDLPREKHCAAASGYLSLNSSGYSTAPQTISSTTSPSR